MFMVYRGLFLIYCLVGIFSMQARAQNGPVLPLDDPALWHYNAFLVRGLLTDIDSGTFPLQESAFRLSLKGPSGSSEKQDGKQLAGSNALLTDLVNRSIERLFETKESSLYAYGIRVRPGLSVASMESANFLRPERSRSSVVYSLFTYESWFTAGGLTAAWGWRHDRYYDRDPEGLDTAHRLAIRTENAYISYKGRFGQVRFGRVRQHWGGYNQPGLILSDNPRPMDHLSYQFGTDRLHVSSSISELDSITGDGQFTGSAGDDSVSTGSERRYLAAHRLTFSKPGKWQVGLMHSVLYSGRNSGFSLKFANPFQIAIFSVDEKPKNDENNGLLGAFFQITQANTLFQAQVALDDFDVLNGTEPPSIAGTVFLYRADILPHADLSVGSTIVTGRAYNANQPEGKYLYLGRGIATQYSDYISGFIEMPLFVANGIVVSPRIDALFQGSGDIRRPFPGQSQAPTIFEGSVSRTIRFSVDAKAQLSNLIDIQASLGMNNRSFDNGGSRHTDSFLTGMFSISYRKMWTGTFH